MAWTSRIGISLPAWRLSLGDTLARISLWRHRVRSRRDLMRLNEEHLRDIGIDSLAAVEEARKPFWRG